VRALDSVGLALAGVSAVLSALGLWTSAWISGLALVVVITTTAALRQRDAMRRLELTFAVQVRSVRSDIDDLRAEAQLLRTELAAETRRSQTNLGDSVERARADLASMLVRLQEQLDRTSGTADDVEAKLDSLGGRTAVGIERTRTDMLQALAAAGERPPGTETTDRVVR